MVRLKPGEQRTLRVSVQLPISIHAEVKAIASARGVFVNRVVQELMEEALVRYKMRAPSTQVPGQISFT